MLTMEQNERLIRVGPGTPAGNLFRRYWQPALLSSELPERDCAPVRVRLLGEDLIGFRDTAGRVGLVDAYCPHRRVPLFFARNEEGGLRCVYHGWKFNVDGDCAELPTEPAASRMKDRVKLSAYPTAELGGVVWTYMGPAEYRPALPDFEWLRTPENHRFVSKTFESCNYLQALEGGLDTSHTSFLHNEELQNKAQLRQRDRRPRIEVNKTEYGFYYVSTRDVGEDGQYVRVYQYLMPFQQLRGGVITARERNELPKLDGHIWVPVDDEHVFVYNVMYSYDVSGPISREYAEDWERVSGRGEEDLLPGTFRLRRNRDNDYLIDRQRQKTTTFSGIVGINTQDFALQEGMGVIADRAGEHLGSSDQAIIAMRLMLLEATREIEMGRDPRGIDPSSYRDARPYDLLVPRGVDWRSVGTSELNAKW